MARRKKVYEGKAKILYEGPEPDTLIQYFKDDTTAFDATKKAVAEQVQAAKEATDQTQRWASAGESVLSQVRGLVGMAGGITSLAGAVGAVAAKYEDMARQARQAQQARQARQVRQARLRHHRHHCSPHTFAHIPVWQPNTTRLQPTTNTGFRCRRTRRVHT